MCRACIWKGGSAATTWIPLDSCAQKASDRDTWTDIIQVLALAYQYAAVGVRPLCRHDHRRWLPSDRVRGQVVGTWLRVRMCVAQVSEPTGSGTSKTYIIQSTMQALGVAGSARADQTKRTLPGCTHRALLLARMIGSRTLGVDNGCPVHFSCRPWLPIAVLLVAFGRLWQPSCGGWVPMALLLMRTDT